MAADKEKLIISELLFFIKNKLASTTKDAVVQMCVKFFFEEEINAAMSALEQTLGIRLPKRYNKGEDISVKHVTDLYDRLLSFDASSTPIHFLAADITRIPSAEWEQANSDSLASPEQLLASIHSLRRIVTQLQSQMVTREFLEASISRIRNNVVNDADGFSTYPTPLQSSPSMQSEESSSEEFPPLPQRPPPPHAMLTPSAPDASQSASAASAPLASAASASTTSDSTASSGPTSAVSLSDRRRGEVVDRQRGKVGRNPPHVGGNKKSLNKRDRNSPIVIGKNVTAGLMSLKGADLTVARYIGRLALGTTPEQIQTSLEERSVDVVSCEAIPTKRPAPSFSSFKLVVKKSQLPIIEKDDFWPDGVIVGRYWSPKAALETAAAAAVALAAAADTPRTTLTQ